MQEEKPIELQLIEIYKATFNHYAKEKVIASEEYQASWENSPSSAIRSICKQGKIDGIGYLMKKQTQQLLKSIEKVQPVEKTPAIIPEKVFRPFGEEEQQPTYYYVSPEKFGPPPELKPFGDEKIEQLEPLTDFASSKKFEPTPELKPFGYEEDFDSLLQEEAKSR